MNLRETFGTDQPLIGMVHLPALPGAPGYEGPRSRIRERALTDAEALVAGGIDAVLVENFGDVPFYPDDVPPHVLTEMTAVVAEIRRAVDVPVGVNVLRNDVAGAISVAAATGGSFVRANLHAGAQVTDQGLLEGAAHETVRLRERIDADGTGGANGPGSADGTGGADVAVLADVSVKHAAPLADRPIADAAVETVERGLADGLIVTGPATGDAADVDDLQAVADRRSAEGLDVPVLVGSGVTPENVDDLLAVADGAIAGTSLERDADVANPVDEDRVRTLVEAADRTRD